jgi:hypothetical protein
MFVQTLGELLSLVVEKVRAGEHVVNLGQPGTCGVLCYSWGEDEAERVEMSWVFFRDGRWGDLSRVPEWFGESWETVAHWLETPRGRDRLPYLVLSLCCACGKPIPFLDTMSFSHWHWHPECLLRGLNVMRVDGGFPLVTMEEFREIHKAAFESNKRFLQR